MKKTNNKKKKQENYFKKNGLEIKLSSRTRTLEFTFNRKEYSNLNSGIIRKLINIYIENFIPESILLQIKPKSRLKTFLEYDERGRTKNKRFIRYILNDDIGINCYITPDKYEIRMAPFPSEEKAELYFDAFKLR